MRQDVKDFFDIHFGGVDGFIAKAGRRGFDGEQVRQACEIVYDKHHNGKPYSSLIVMGQQVHAEAEKLVRIRKHVELDMLMDLQRRIALLEQPSLLERIFDPYR